MKFHFTFSLLLLALLQNLSAQPLHFRTDGYYYYDNRCDTIYVMNTRDRKNAEWVKTIKKTGMIIDDTAAYIPGHTIPFMGGSTINVLAFFSDEKGMYNNGCYWDSERYKTLLQKTKKLKERKQQTDNNGEYVTVRKLNKNNTFILNAGFSASTRKIITGTLYTDKLVVKEKFLMPGFGAEKSRVYRFYRYDQSPPKRNKFVYVYKPAMWQHD